MSEATQSGLSTLPSELVYHIIRLAASTDPRTAHVCAHVSKQVCDWTSPDRWKTVIITHWSQLDAVRLCLENAEALETGAERAFTSLPSALPGDFVENLFIDTEHTLAEENPSKQIYAFACFTSAIPFFRHLNYLALGLEETESFMLHFHHLSPSKILGLYSGGEWSVQVWDRLLYDQMCGPHWTRCRCRADAAAAESSSTQLTHDRFCPRLVPTFSRFRRRLKSVHLIGIDRDSKVTGVPTPFRLLENLRSGSTDQGSFLYALAAESRHGENNRVWPAADDQPDPVYFASKSDQQGHEESFSRMLSSSKLLDPQSWSGGGVVGGKSPYDNPYGNVSRSYFTDTALGATSLRYDTRQFAFRPCEITAIHLKRFFQELVVSCTPGLAPVEATPPSNNFTHVGPRHAAPHRGAGNYHHLSIGQVRQTSPLQPLLDNLGSRQFRKLELCWDPLTPLQRSEVPAAAQAATIESESGWPMERQDIWTNTTSQNSNARAPPPHQGSAPHKTRAQPSRFGSRTGASRWRVNADELSANSRAFRADLFDSIRTTLGWTAQDQEQLNLAAPAYRSPARLRGSTATEYTNPQLDRSFHRILHELVHRTDPDADELPGVHLAVQPPINKLKLGEHCVPYTKEERIAWFLDNLHTDDA